MRLAFRRFVLAIGLASLLGASTVSAGALVDFPNLPGQTPVDLSGYLARPDTGLAGGQPSAGAPYPAVVVLHGCGGISSHSAAIADRFGSWGYIALTVDSFSSRGIATNAARDRSTRRSTPMPPCATFRVWKTSIRRAWRSSANRWAVSMNRMG